MTTPTNRMALLEACRVVEASGTLTVVSREALERTGAQRDHFLKKWHAWHVHTGIIGLTCPLCPRRVIE